VFASAKLDPEGGYEEGPEGQGAEREGVVEANKVYRQRQQKERHSGRVRPEERNRRRGKRYDKGEYPNREEQVLRGALEEYFHPPDERRLLFGWKIRGAAGEDTGAYAGHGVPDVVEDREGTRVTLLTATEIPRRPSVSIQIAAPMNAKSANWSVCIVSHQSAMGTNWPVRSSYGDG